MTTSGSSTAATAATISAIRSASRSTAAWAATPPRRAASKTCRAERRADMPSSAAVLTTPCAATVSSNVPQRIP